MTEEWRNSEAQVIQLGRWVRLNGTDAEILIPAQGGAGGGGVSGVSFGGAGGGGTPGYGGGGTMSAGGGGAGGVGSSNATPGQGGAGGSAGGALVIRVRRASSGPSMAGTPVLVRQAADADGEEFREEWYCDVPPLGALYTVVRQEWDAEYRVRKILEVRLGS